MMLQKVLRNVFSNDAVASAGAAPLPQGRLKEHVPVAVIDIGSNSVRQVIYEGLTRAPAVLFNEKVLCGLGSGMVASNRLNDKGVERALAALRRFKALRRLLDVRDVHIFATAAARDAENGPDFIDQVTAISGHAVEVLTGAREAEYSALGIKSGFHKPNGIVGDMGGGSLELIGINGETEPGITLPLGGLRLRDLAGGSVEKARKIAREQLKKATVEWPAKERTFYAVGGTWRSLGKLHIASHSYPLPAVHDYEVAADEMADFCREIAEKGPAHMRGITAVSKNRRDLLPFGALVLGEIIRRFEPKTIALSSLGIREGFLYSRLSEAERQRDSLLAAARDLSILRARAPDHSLELAAWTGMAFAELGIKESENESRYRISACYLADIGWRAHPDFRAQQALAILSNTGFIGIDHAGRAYLAVSNFHRYQGLGSKVRAPRIAELAPAPVLAKARILAAMFRVLYLFSAAMPGIIPQLGIRRTGEEKAAIIVPRSISDLCGERPKERISQLGRELKMKVSLEITDG